MNNSDFRNLVSSTPARQENNGATPAARPTAFGARKSAFAGMTPRPGKALGGDDFARQVREQHANFKPTKKFKSVAPKGSKFGAGYTDRAKARQEAEDVEEDDKAKRIKALEEQVKLGQLPQETFEALRDEILGGDASTTHLVKGLDRKLLERVRRGEDVLGLNQKEGDEEPSLDVDDELEQLGGKEVEAVKKEKTEKKGIMAPPSIAGKKRTRDEIMAELKAQRQAAAQAKAEAAPTLDSRWKRVGDQAQPKVDIDHKGREVVTIVKEDGTVKKLIRKAQGTAENKVSADMPDISKPILGADVIVPDANAMDVDDEDDDIFAGAGTEYNPLGDVDDDDDDIVSDDETKPPQTQAPKSEHAQRAATAQPQVTDDEATENKNAPPDHIKAPRNYFGKSTGSNEEPAENRFNGVENVLKKAAKLGTERSGAEEDEEDDESGTREEREARRAKHARMLAQQDRDMDDIDMGFGGSRGEDEADFEETKVKLSQWKGGAKGGDDDDDGDGNGKSKGEKKKRKPKKRKGDANNMADILRVIEGRKGGGSK